MIQFFRFNSAAVDSYEADMISGRDAVKFFLKRTLYLVLFIYSTLFLAVALPFVETPCIPVYFVGGLATSYFIIRFINYIISYIRLSGGKIHVTGSSVEVKTAKGSIKIPAESITYLERNILGNLLIREKFATTSIPLVFFSMEDREKLLALFTDMAPKRTAIYRKIWEFVDAIVVALILAVHIIQYVVQAYYIPTGSMEDTLKVGDHLFVEKITYGPVIPAMMGMEKPAHVRWLGIRGVQKGDIVIFRPPHEENKDYIKRCIAVPGDRFEIRNGSVFINGSAIDEPYTKGLTTYYIGSLTKDMIEGVVPEGKVIVLGDNRENSQDSRYFGYLDIERIKGKAFILYWNTSQFIGQLDFTRLGLIK